MQAPSTHYQGQDLEALADIPNYQRWILDHFAPYLRGRVLEIGAGIGSISALYADRVDDLVLLEPAHNLSRQLETKFATRPHTRVLGQTLEVACVDAADALQPASFDAVLLVNVLEHVADDAAMLARIYTLLRPGGYLLLFVPALSWLFGTLDQLVGHERRYELGALKQEVHAQGFSILNVRYFDALGILPWFVTGRVLKQQVFNAKAATLYDNVAVPVGRSLEHWLRPPLGKNLLCIGRKP